ncbi:stage II sporulation protein M [Clostridium sp. Cult3]|uniref:stage II sporulation protein M n=1 Tax=Clostridium sp. Cult3 TaxID=2079004 RepID=UPI001F020A5D|nr:stage II sporulation protein M [Clostridium sp. Cult3]MCF6459710.1 stage II sporulation protein M [Clostridium sp. Cult3]
MPYKIKRWLFKQFQENFAIYFIVAIVFAIGIITGAVTIKVLNSEQKNGIMIFINTFFRAMGNNSFENLSIFKQSLIDNFKTIGLIYITGLVIIGIPIIPVTVMFRGFALGFTVGFLVNEYGLQGFLFSILGILPQNLIIIPAILSISSIGMAFSMKSIKNRKFKSINNNMHWNIVNYSILILFFSIIVIIGCLIEAYISPIFLRLISDYFN